jgi:WD40 repeat protein
MVLDGRIKIVTAKHFWRKLGIRPSAANVTMLLFGFVLLLVAWLGPRVIINGTQIQKDTPWWVQVVLTVVGLVVIAWTLFASRHAPERLWTARGFLGTPPRVPVRYVARPEVSEAVVAAVCDDSRPVVALTGIGGVGKSTLAAQACRDQRVHQSFPDGITWLEAGPSRDPVSLLADLARRLGLSDAASVIATVLEAQDKISAALQGKRILIVLDNVWERVTLDALIGLAEDYSVLFTTRIPEIAATFGASRVDIDELTQHQALQLLEQWTGTDLPGWPAEARRLCTRVDNLALAVAMAGAMVAGGRSFTDVLALIEHDLDRVRANLDPPLRYRSLFAAIEAGLSVLSEENQRRYEQLAVFGKHGPFPREAAWVLWQPELSEAEVGDVLAEFTGRSLLTSRGDGWFVAHGLQSDFLTRRAGDDRLASLHARLIDGYLVRFKEDWGQAADDPYLSRALAAHMHDAGRVSDLTELLTNVRWIVARLASGQLAGLMSDYRLTDDKLSREIGRALRLSAHVLATDPSLVHGQLAGRLSRHHDPDVRTWAEMLAAEGGERFWLAPVTRALTPSNSALRQILTGHHRFVLSVSVATDGTIATSGGTDGTLRVWDLAGGRIRAVLPTHAGPLSSVVVMPGVTVAVTGGQDGSIRIWDLTEQRETARLPAHKGAVSSLAVAANGALMVSGGDDGLVRIWDTASRKELGALKGHSDGVRSVAVTADGRRAISGSRDGSIRVWDVENQRQEFALTGHDGPVLSVATSNDGALVVSGGADGSARVWNTATRAESAILTGHSGGVLSIAISADRALLVSSGSDHTIRVWDLVKGRQIRVLGGHAGRVMSVSMAGQDLVISGSADGSVRVWDLGVTEEASQHSEDHGSSVYAVCLATEAAVAVNGKSNGSISIWDLTSGNQRAEYSSGQSGTFSSVAVTPDASLAVSGGGDGSIRVWRLSSGGPHQELTVEGGWSWPSVAVTPDGRLAVSGAGDGFLRVWDLRALRQDGVIAGAGGLRNVAVSASGDLAVSGGDDGCVRVWDLVARRQIFELTGHRGWVLSVAISEDGRLALSGGEDGTLRVWDLVTGLEQFVLARRGRPWQSVAFNPKGTIAVSGSDDGLVTIWDLAIGSEIAHWVGDYGILACVVLGDHPLRVGIAQRQQQPYVLEVRNRLLSVRANYK